MEHTKAKESADRLVTELSPFCGRIEIAGSIRRNKSEVHDIEIVAIPKSIPILDIFQQEVDKCNLLNEHIIGARYVCDKNGDRYKKIIYTSEINVDLFIVLSPAQWGVRRRSASRRTTCLVSRRRTGRGIIPLPGFFA